MKKISLFPLLAATTVSQMMFSSCSSEQEKEQPNFVLIFCDDMGYGDLGCYGNPTIHTPNIDRMASEGMKFTQFYVVASVSTPSRSALMTGRLPVRNGLYGDKRDVLFPDSKAGLGQDEVTVAKLLQQNGYATACVGKWHLGHFSPYLPTDHGFDDFFGIPYSNDMRPASLMRGDSVLEIKPEQGELTRRYTEYAVDYIKKNKNRPFFLYLAHTFPHTPLHTNERFEGRSNRGLYGDVVEELDWSVGEVLKALKENGLDENTLVIFTSDNGPAPSFKGSRAGNMRGCKASLFEGGIHMPFIIWDTKGEIPSGKTDDTTVVSALDLYKSLSSLAGIKLPADCKSDGMDMSAALKGVPQERREPLFWEYRRNESKAFPRPADKDVSPAIAVRYGKWKLLVDKDSTNVLLYDLEDNLRENVDLSKKHPQVASRLSKLALEWWNSLPEF